MFSSPLLEAMSVDDNSSNSADAEMYTSEKSQSMNVTDVDSGIETMEVDEAESKIELKRRRVSALEFRLLSRLNIIVNSPITR